MRAARRLIEADGSWNFVRLAMNIDMEVHPIQFAHQTPIECCDRLRYERQMRITSSLDWIASWCTIKSKSIWNVRWP